MFSIATYNQKMLRNILKAQLNIKHTVISQVNHSLSSSSCSRFSIAILKTPHHKQLAKIVATIGPKSEQLPVLKKVVDAGMKIMRINFSHATYEEADLRAANIAKCSSESGARENNIYSVMLDTQGPEIRTGSFDNHIKETELLAGNKVVLSVDPEVRNKQTVSKIWISYNQLMQSVHPGTSILLDDGAIELLVEKVEMTTLEVHCKVLNTGMLGNKKGVNIPGTLISLFFIMRNTVLVNIKSTCICFYLLTYKKSQVETFYCQRCAIKTKRTLNGVSPTTLISLPLRSFVSQAMYWKSENI